MIAASQANLLGGEGIGAIIGTKQVVTYQNQRSGLTQVPENPLQNQSQFNQIFQSVPLGIGLVDDQFRLTTANPALLAILNCDEKQLKDACFPDLCHPADREKLAALLVSSGQPPEGFQQEEIRLQGTDGSHRWVEITVSQHPPGEELQRQRLLVFQDIQQRKEMELEVGELRRRLNDQVEKQRMHLAQELHDGAMQDMHSMQYQLSALQRGLSDDHQNQLEAVMETVQMVKQELRTISYDLRPPVLSRFGLAKSIRSHADEFIDNHPEFTLTLNLVDDGTLLDEEIRLALFRIYQQALGNIMQHAEASRIEVGLAFTGKDVKLWIRDDGRGFSVPDSWIGLVRGGHYGLAGSQDRISGLGGEFMVRSGSGQGTEIMVHIPDVLED